MKDHTLFACFYSNHRAGGTAAGFSRPQQGGNENEGEQEEAGSPRSTSGSSTDMSLLAHDLAGVAGQLGMQLETFSVGAVAHQLGE